MTIHYCRENPCPVCTAGRTPGGDVRFGPTTSPYPFPTMTVYPCDKGIPGNVQGRGYHEFQSSPNGVICCRYCGRKPGA